MLSSLLKISPTFVCKLHQRKNGDKINKFSSKQTITLATVALSFTLFSSNPAKATSFTFSQNNWQYGGNLSGSFTGDDLNNDGKIDASELSVFNATFSGNLRRDNNIPIAPPIIISTTISHSPPALNSNPTLESFSFNYSPSTSEFRFSSFKGQCFIHPRGCSTINNFTSIEVSNINDVTDYDNSRHFGLINFRPPYSGGWIFRSTSSSAPSVTPLQQPIPEPSTLAATVFTSLGFLLKRKVISSRPK
jgi:hypothetical protein